MIKILNICFILCFVTILHAQQSDSTNVSNEKLIELSEKQKQSARRDSLQTALINEQSLKINNLITLTERDSIEISLLNLQINSQQKIITILQPTTKKWYESKWFYYALGSLTMYLSAELVSNVK